MRELFKWISLIIILISYLVLSGIVCTFPVIRRKKRQIAMRLASFFAARFLRVLGVHVHVKHADRLTKNREVVLIVSNHVSYLDVLVISSLIPSAFITSVELKHTPVLGWMARLSGSLFVERRKPAGLKQEIDEIALVLGQGLPVALFPEGTTSNGDRVHPFKNSLFDAAVATRADILPLCLRYTRVNGKPLTQEERDSVYYYGGVSFFIHLPRLLALRSVDIEVSPLKWIVVQPHHNRKDLATMAQDAISAAYHE